MSSHAHAGHRRLFLLTSTSTSLAFVAAVLLLIVDACAASRQFSTVAISHAPNATLVCALVTSADDAGAGPPGSSKLRCTSLPDGQQFVYPSADIPYNAIAAGTDFLCGLMAPLGGHAAMRWWSFSEEFAANRSRPVGRRLYWGPSLRSLSAGGSHACGLSDDHGPSCWEWPRLALPKGLDFSRIALGHDFLCGIDKLDNTSMSCFGAMTAPSLAPAPAAFATVAAGHRHACAVDAEGGFGCWGDDDGDVPDVPAHELPADMLAMALGNGSTCILSGSGRVQCWGAVQVPDQYRNADFLAIEADGGAVCGILRSNYSVACWGRSDRFGTGGSLVYNSTMPGACTRKKSCPCDIISGSGALCGSGGAEGGEELAVCQACAVRLNASRLLITNGRERSAAGDDDSGKRKARTLAVALGVGGAGAAVLAAAAVALYVVSYRKRDNKKTLTLRLGESSSRRLCRDVEATAMPAPPVPPLGCEEFTLRDLSRVTDGFSEEKKIGSGSFGSVYRARLPDGREVAIKRAERSGSGGRRRRRFDAERAFRAELRLLSRVNHRNLVQLLGFCEERGERILVFEFMPHGALHDHLHGSGRRNDDGGYSPLFASWEARLRVALDAARGVEYLHCYAVPAIIHRDVKPSNILLDGDWTAKVSDFGLSLASGGTGASASPASATAGTVGYIDPEYYRLQELTERSDVYSFGVVLLELVTGRKAIHRTNQDGSGSPRNVVEFAVPAVEAGSVTKILDERVPPPRGHEVEAVARVAKIASECVRPRGRARPIMSEVVAELEWAVTLCEESVVAAAGHNSSRHGGSDLSRSRSRSESDDPSPFHTRELGFGFGFGLGLGSSRPVTHGRSHSTM
ncbi:Serine/threonine-protein kinase-like protein CCR4 [Zea mays]|jgi:serine/threonine protein kinase|uniref:Serine/threonine-protein kinase-like protein CCR4 n=1 Tax=Zea mays TaxID=4577 RepID=A0A3L6F365_MAIZE|nr:Serine/threonine-protein kinase-like protein CCR4 [Zea mays]